MYYMVSSPLAKSWDELSGDELSGDERVGLLNIFEY